VFTGRALIFTTCLALLWVLPSAALVAAIGSSPNAPLDFYIFSASGRESAAGLNPYDPAGGMNMNAPTSLLLFHALALLYPGLPAILWAALSGLLYLACLYLLWQVYPSRTPVLLIGWAVAQNGIWSTLALGQIYVLLLVPVAVAWYLFTRGRPLWGAALLGPLVVVKPNFALWPAMLYLAGYRRDAVISTASAVVFAAMPVLAYGPGIYLAWLNGARVLSPGEIAHHANASLISLATRAGIPELGWAGAATLIATVVWWSCRRRPPMADVSTAALASACITSPIAWPGYVTVLLPVFFRPWNRWLWIAALLLMFPYWVAITVLGPWRPAWELTTSVVFFALLLSATLRKSAA